MTEPGMELAELGVRVTARGAISETDRLTDAFKRNTREAHATEAAQEKFGHQLMRTASAEREAYREAARMAQANRDAARATTSLQQGVVMADAGLRRIAAAEREAYREAERLAKAQKQVAGESVGVARALGLVGGYFTTGAFIRGAVQFANVADHAKLLSARIALVTTGSGELVKVQDALFASAQRTRTSYEDQVTLYTRVARNAGALGKSQAELLKVTELVSMQMQISGATASEASAGVMQLSQALAKGRLDGDEFRTMMEVMPTVADALAKSLGVPKAALFDLSAQGRLTARQIVDAVNKTEKGTRDAFEKLPKTLSGAWTQASNQMGRDIAALDQRLGESKTLQFLLTGASRTFTALVNPRGLKLDAPDGATNAHGSASASALEYLDSIAAVRAAERQALADRRAAFDEARRNAKEREAWENAELLRAVRLGDARFRAENPGGPRAPTFARNTLDLTVTEQRNAGGQITRRGYAPGQGVGLADLPDSIRNAGKQLTALQARSKQAAEEALARQQEMAEASAHIQENFLRGLQGGFTEFFRGIATEGKLTFTGLMTGFRDVVLNTFAELASQRLMQSLFGGADKAGGAGGLLSGPVGTAIGIGALVFGGLFGSRRRAPRAPRYQMSPWQQGEFTRLQALEQSLQDPDRRDQVRTAVGSAVQEGTAIQMLGYLQSMRDAAVEQVGLQRQMVALLRGGGLANGVNAQLGQQVQLLRLAKGVAVTP